MRISLKQLKQIIKEEISNMNKSSDNEQDVDALYKQGVTALEAAGFQVEPLTDDVTDINVDSADGIVVVPDGFLRDVLPDVGVALEATFGPQQRNPRGGGSWHLGDAIASYGIGSDGTKDSITFGVSVTYDDESAEEYDNEI